MPQRGMSTQVWRVVLAATTVAGVLAVAACGSDDHSSPATTAGKPAARHIAKNPAELLLPVDQFPANYPATTLSAEKKAAVLKELGGSAGEVKVEPAECAGTATALPKLGPDAMAIATGVNTKTFDSIAIAVARVNGDFADRKALLRKCPDTTMSAGGSTVKAHHELLAAPKVEADDSFAARTTAGASGGEARGTLKTITLQLSAQVGDIVITGMQTVFGDKAPADTTALDTTFAKAVARVRAA